MSRLALAVALSLATIGAARAEFAEKPFAPEIGSRWTIEDAQDTVSSGTDGARRTQSVRQTSEVVFEERLADGWRVSFAIKDISVSGTAPGVAAVGPALESMKGVAFSASTDKRGKPRTVLNLDEARAGMQAVVEKAAAGFAAKPQVANALRSMLGNLMVLDGAQAAEAYLEPLTLVSHAHETGLKPGEDRSETVARPNPLGGEAIKTVARMRIAEPDPDGVTIVTRTEAYEPESLKTSIASAGRKLLTSVGSEARITPDELDRVIKMLTVSYDYLAVYDVANGMAREVTTSSQTQVSAMGQSFSQEDKRRLTISRAP